jgi:hypothetical protein
VVAAISVQSACGLQISEFVRLTRTSGIDGMVIGADERRERNRQAAQRWRARLTPAERDEIRRYQRERARRIKQQSAPVSPRATPPTPARAPSNASPDAVQPIRPVDCRDAEPNRGWSDNEIPRLRPVAAAAKENALQRLRLALGPSGLDEATCAVCDCSKLRSACRAIAVSDTDRMERMRALLSSADEALPAELIAEYDCSRQNAALDGMLLSKRGVRSNGDLDVCEECDAILRKRSIPKFAIKNGFAVGSLPGCLADITLPERLMTQTVSIVAVTRVMRGGVHRSIRSHCLAFDCTPGPAATLLPIPVDDATSYRVVLAGPFTTEQQARVRQMHRVRRPVVEQVLRFYKRHNALYNGVAVDCSGLSTEAIQEQSDLRTRGCRRRSRRYGHRARPSRRRVRE